MSNDKTVFVNDPKEVRIDNYAGGSLVKLFVEKYFKPFRSSNEKALEGLDMHIELYYAEPIAVIKVENIVFCQQPVNSLYPIVTDLICAVVSNSVDKTLAIEMQNLIFRHIENVIETAFSEQEHIGTYGFVISEKLNVVCLVTRKFIHDEFDCYDFEVFMSPNVDCDLMKNVFNAIKGN